MSRRERKVRRLLIRRAATAEAIAIIRARLILSGFDLSEADGEEDQQGRQIN